MWRRWITKSWWGYLLAPREEPYNTWLATVRCRAKGHPCGEVYWNAGGLEPDHHGSNCGDMIG